MKYRQAKKRLTKALELFDQVIRQNPLNSTAIAGYKFLLQEIKSLKDNK